MAAKVQKNESERLSEVIIEGILDKKGEEVVRLNLSNIPNSVSNYFVVCHANSKIQVEAIAGSVEDHTIKKLKAKPWHREGFENAEWILLDYVDVVVHIFQEEARKFYSLEELWADAETERFDLK